MQDRFQQRLGLLTVFATCACLGRQAAADDVRSVAAELGITPESLVAAGLQDQATTILTQLQAAGTLRQSLEQQHATAVAGAESLGLASAGMQQSAADDSLTDVFQAAATAYQAANAAIAQTIEELRGIALDGVSESASAILMCWIQSGRRQVPASFRVNTRTEEQWMAIETALRSEARSVMHDAGVEAEAAALLASVRQESAVSAAAARLQEGTASIETVFGQFSQ